MIEEIHDELGAQLVLDVRDTQDAVREAFVSSYESILGPKESKETNWRMRPEPETERDVVAQRAVLHCQGF